MRAKRIDEIRKNKDFLPTIGVGKSALLPYKAVVKQFPWFARNKMWPLRDVIEEMKEGGNEEANKELDNVVSIAIGHFAIEDYVAFWSRENEDVDELVFSFEEESLPWSHPDIDKTIPFDDGDEYTISLYLSKNGTDTSLLVTDVELSDDRRFAGRTIIIRAR
jgi:hypothetical protein